MSAKSCSKCGIDCGTCPWGPYPRKRMTTEGFERYRNNAKRILGYMPIKTPCVTCQIRDAEIPKESKLPSRNCLIRKCADKAGITNCAYCSRFPCDTLKATAGAWNRESIELKLGASLSEAEYHTFVEPFQGIRRLEAIHASLKPEEIVEPSKVLTHRTNIADFPGNLPFSKEETASFKSVYDLLATLKQSSLGLSGTDTFAQQHKLENLRTFLLRFLWILGSCGKLESEKRMHLVVDAENYFANRGSEKSLAIWSFMQDTVFRILTDFGVSCERVTLKGFKEEELTTGTGYLRYKGWVMKMSFDEKIGGTAALKALQTYISLLNKKYEKKAFQHFQDIDIQILSETRP